MGDGWQFKKLEGVPLYAPTDDDGDIVEIVVTLPPPDPEPLRLVGAQRAHEELVRLADIYSNPDFDPGNPDDGPWLEGWRGVWQKIKEQAQAELEKVSDDERA